MEDILGHQCLYYSTTNESGDLTAVLPLVRVKSLLFGHFLTSMPFLNYGGPLGNNAAVESLVQLAIDTAKSEKVDIMELRSGHELDISLPVSHRKITVMLDLPEGGEDTLWKAFNAKVRNQVRRPQKEGIEVRFGRDQIDSFFNVFSRNMRDLGTPTLSRRFFETVADTFPEDVMVGCAYYKDTPVAGGYGFRWGDEFEMTWASSLREYNRLGPNMLLYWEFIRQSIQQGIKLFNFGRCSPGVGTHKFKLQWGSRDQDLWWYELRAPGASMPSEGEGAIGMGPKIWSKLPLPVATALGPQVIRFIP